MEATNSVTLSNMMFPSKGLQVLSCLVCILGVSILAHCLSRRLASEELSSWASLREITWARMCVLMVFLDSWLFLFASGILVFGIGLESSGLVCAMAIYLCVLFYATSKLLIYSFLVEKVYLVWSPTVGSQRRLKSPVYLVCVAMIGVYGVVIAMMVAGNINFLRETDGVCIIGLERYSSISLLSYDLFISIFLTILFLWPIFRAKLSNPRLRAVAIRTLVAAGVALTTSTINMLVLALMKGHERGWICLGSCGADVIFNALAIFWVTKNSRSQSQALASSVRGGEGGTRRPPDIKILSPTQANLALGSPPSTPTTASPSTPRFSFSSSSLPGMGRKHSPVRAKQSVSPTSEDLEDMELQFRPSVMRSVTGLFRPEQHQPSDHAVVVTITQDFETVTDDPTPDRLVHGDEESQVDSK